MTWEETIDYIRTLPEYKDLVELAYFEKDLSLNVKRFRKSEEYFETKKLLSEYTNLDSSVKMIDIGSGNGISAVAFALDGVNVTAVEPDPSETIGAGAIRQLKEEFNLLNLDIFEGFAEELKFPDGYFDIVYTRQCMHHAKNLQQFLNESHRVLKKGGLLVTIRDHVIFDEKDKEWFLKSHPLQKFYGGENAFNAAEYKLAMENAGFVIKRELKHFDNVINHFPLDKEDKIRRETDFTDLINSIVEKKLGVLSKSQIVRKIAFAKVKKRLKNPFDELAIPGRMYSYVAKKE